MHGLHQMQLHVTAPLHLCEPQGVGLVEAAAIPVSI